MADEAPVVLVLALTVPLLLGCASATPDPIRIGSAPAEPTGKLNLDLAVRPSGYVEASRLPDACDLLTDRDLRAVFLQAEGIERDAEDRRLVVTDPPSSSDPYPSGRGVRLKNAFCTTAFSLPGVERLDPPGLSRGYEVTVEIDEAGTEELIRSTLRLRLKLREYESRASHGGADCIVNALNAVRFSCFKGRLSFTLVAERFVQRENRELQGDQPGDGTRIRYQVGTKVATFKVDNYEALERFENEHIRSELVKAVASKL